MTNETNEVLQSSTEETPEIIIDSTEETPEIITDSTEEKSEIIIDSTEETPEITTDSTEETPEIITDSTETYTPLHTEEHEEEDDDSEAASIDFSRHTKNDFLQLLHELDKETDFRKIMPTLKHAKPHFDHIIDMERDQVLQKFIAEGGVEIDFKFREDKTTKEFYRLYNQIQKNRAKQLVQLEEQKQKNFVAKEAILQKIRELVEKGEETKQAIDELKRLQTEWKSIGAVPMAHTHELWAKFDALADRFYDNLKIHRELADLDRKKNLAEKIDICEKAERLVELPISKAIKELNRLHEEFKHIGPVPRKDQEDIWKRFKLASDKIYEVKREQSKVKDDERKDNLTKKWALCELVKPYADYTTDRVADWNTKTQEILDLQKQWEAIRDIPQESVKEVSKAFWTLFKKFFSNKNTFLHALDEERESNLAKKVAICEEAEALVGSQEDARRIADTLKQMQVKWREIGAVPSKYRDSIYNRFKKICDGFFAQRREQASSQDKEFEDNLVAKKAIIAKMKDFKPAEDTDYQVIIDGFLGEWKLIGFVPKKDKDAIQDAFNAEINNLVQGLSLTEEEKDKLSLHADMALMQDSPQAGRKIQQREQALRRKISKLEGDIDTLKNNMGFFAKSNKADALKADIERQIKEANEKLATLKKQLRLLQNM